MSLEKNEGRERLFEAVDFLVGAARVADGCGSVEEECAPSEGDWAPLRRELRV